MRNQNSSSAKQQQQQQHSHKHHQHNQQVRPSANEFEATKLDYAIAKHLRNNLPNKEAMFVGIKRVNYFIGSKAVDLLMESQYCLRTSDNNKEAENENESSKAAATSEAIFKTRDDVVIYLNNLLLKKFYHRAKKIVKMDGAKKKFKLDMHDIQVFEDANQPYVWLYEPTSLKAWLLCFGVIFAVIAICLFPLWPSFIRTGIYYLCIAGLVFLSSLLTLAIVRHIIFFILWTITFGKLHLWILPNLTEDVGFFESFWPLYTIEQGPAQGDADSSAATAPTGDSSSHTHQDWIKFIISYYYIMNLM